jgi:protein-tyrosine phosphatase
VSAQHYRILMVCTGNTCRSPVMERLFVARVQAALPAAEAAQLQVRSVGTRATPGEDIDPEAARTLVKLGGDPSSFASRPVDAINPGDADLILTASRGHTAAIVQAQPQVVNRVMTLRMFARLLTGVTAREIDNRMTRPDIADRMVAVTAAAFARRGLVQPARPEDDDIPDPHGRRRKAYRRTAQLIDDALAVPLALLLPGEDQKAGRHRA